MSAGVYRQHRNTIIEWTVDTHSGIAALDRGAAGRFGDEVETEALAAYEDMTGGNNMTQNLRDYMDGRLARLDEIRSG